ncbi:MAG: DUF5717 family protein [Lachnospiraceae bacterium]|nr:DUF5717 family protein [Lachnospiraceae bacterium]
MENHIAEILNGRFEYDMGTLTFPERKLNIEAFVGERVKGTFHIVSSGLRRINGYIYVDDSRMVCDKKSFSANSVEVHYIFDTKGLEPNDLIKGNIDVISDAGEYSLPFVVTIKEQFPVSSDGEIRNLFYFANLARKDFDEAKKLFYDKSFVKVLNGADERYIDLYGAFSRRLDSSENLEEFLIAVHKKNPVGYTVSQDNIDIEIDDEDITAEIRLRKNGWGYAALRVSSDNPFVIVKNTYLTNEDFDGDESSIKLLLVREAMHYGKNTANVRLAGNHFHKDINITVRKKGIVPANVIARQKLIKRITVEYLRFRLKETGIESWCHNSMILIEKMLDMDGKDLLARLFMVHILISSSRKKEAASVLSHIEKEFDTEAAGFEYEAYKIYLQSILMRNEVEVKKNASKIRLMRESCPSSTKLLWILLYMDESLEGNKKKKFELMRELYSYGGRSPLIYAEAFIMIEHNPAYLSTMSEFEINTLLWAAKRGVIREDLLRRIIFQSGKLRRFSGALVSLLQKYYEKFGSEEALGSICTHLIQNNITSEKYFKYFKLAVEKRLKITRLYEYYIYSFPAESDEIVDRSVLMYFRMGAELSIERATFLYDNIIRFGMVSPDTLAAYSSSIAEFAVEMASSGRINEKLARIYDYAAGLKNFANKDKLLYALSRLVFKYKIISDTDDIRYVSVVENGFNGERKYKLTNGEVYISVFSSVYNFIYEDSYGNRTVEREDVRAKRLMQPSAYSRAIKLYREGHIGLSYYSTGLGRKIIEVTDENESDLRILAFSDKISMSERNDIKKKLIHFYYDNGKNDELDKMIADLDVDDFNAADRNEIVRFLILRGMNVRACEILHEYGFSKMNPKTMVRLVSRLIREENNCDANYLTSMAYYVYRHGKYDETILKYLTVNYNGLSRSLRDIWKTAIGFDVGAGRIERKLISQMLFSRAFVGEADEIFKDYAGKDGNDDLARAWLSYCAYDYFVKNRVTGDYIFERIYRLTQEGENFPEIASLAMLHFYSGKHTIPDSAIQGIGAMVRKYMQRGIFMEFFRAFRAIVPEICMYDDRVFVEYHTDPKKQPLLHYRITDEMNSEGVFRSEQMKTVIDGVYIRNFVLFYGERLQYYITEENDGEGELVLSRTVEAAEIEDVGSDSRFKMINSLILSYSLGDEKSTENLMNLYLEKSAAVEREFSLI